MSFDSEHASHDIDDGVTRTLHSIQAGGQHLVMMTRRRVGEILDRLDEGDFRAAWTAAESCQQALGPLAEAQGYIAIAHGARLTAARDLKVGMVLVNVGEVSEVEATECGHAACSGHVKLKIGEHEKTYAGDTEFYVKDEAEAGSGAEDDEPHF